MVVWRLDRNHKLIGAKNPAFQTVISIYNEFANTLVILYTIYHSKTHVYI